MIASGVDKKGQRLWNLKRRITLLEQKVALGTNGWQLDFATATGVRIPQITLR